MPITRTLPMYATTESQRWGDVTDWPRLTVERTERGFELRKNATDVVADIEAAGGQVHQIRIQPEHRGGPALRTLLALVAAKAHGAGVSVLRIEPGPSNAFFTDLVALGFTPETPA